MTKNKTTETNQNVTIFINKVADEVKRRDCFRLLEIFKTHTGFKPKMWGPSIIGFGKYHYKYESGHEGDAPLAAFSPRATSMVIYLSGRFGKRDELLKKFGKHKAGKACIYIKKLDDVNPEILGQMISNSVKEIRKRYPY